MTQNLLVWPDTFPKAPDETSDMITLTGWAVIPYRPDDPPVTIEFYRADSGMVVHEVSLLLGPGDYEIPKEIGDEIDPDLIRIRVVTISGQSTEVQLTKEIKKND